MIDDQSIVSFPPLSFSLSHKIGIPHYSMSTNKPSFLPHHRDTVEAFTTAQHKEMRNSDFNLQQDSIRK